MDREALKATLATLGISQQHAAPCRHRPRRGRVMDTPITVTTTAGRFEARYLVTFANDIRGTHEVKVVTRTGNRTIKPFGRIWNRVVFLAHQQANLLRT